jgi:hypothetical protein
MKSFLVSSPLPNSDAGANIDPSRRLCELEVIGPLRRATEIYWQTSQKPWVREGSV